MQLTVRQAASYFNVDEATVRRWIRTRGLPAHQVDERPLLNAVELWEWAVERGVPVSRRLLDQARRHPDEVSPLAELLARGGIHHDVAAEDKSTVLREVVARLPVPDDVDRDLAARGARADPAHDVRERLGAGPVRGRRRRPA